MCLLGTLSSIAWAENVAPSAHWGAIDFPDRAPTLIAGWTVNRFTEFNLSGARFNSIQQTAGFILPPSVGLTAVPDVQRFSAMAGIAGSSRGLPIPVT